MFSTPGIIKFFWPKDNVENKYSRIYDIPLMDINKRIFSMDPILDENFLVLHISDIKSSENEVKQI